MLEIAAVEPLDGYWLRLTLSDGQVIDRDVGEALWGPVFEPVKTHRDIFEAAFVDGGTVAWPGNVDLAPETLIWGDSPRQTETRTPPARMRVPRLR
jgi:hypothetical protein